MRKLWPGLMLVPVAGLMAACGATPSTTSQGSSGTVVVAEESQPAWWFPIINAVDDIPINTQINFLMYRPLLDITKAGQINFEHSIAQHIQVNAAGDRYVITLGNSYRWSNGQPVTAQDVVFTIQLMLAASQPHTPWVYGGASSGGVPLDWSRVTAEGSHTVVVQLAHPANSHWFIDNGLGQIIPVPKSVWDRYPNNMTKELTFIQSQAARPFSSSYKTIDGPFQLAQAKANNRWTFTPNPHYSGHKARLGHLVLAYEGSSTAEYTALKQGNISVGFLPTDFLKTHQPLPNDVITQTYVPTLNFIAINQSPQAPQGAGALFSQLYIRKALQMGIDEPAMIHDLFDGKGQLSYGPIPPGSPYFDSFLKKPLYPYNPALGRALLVKHGWHLQHGVMTRGSASLQFTMLYGNTDATSSDMAQLLAADWSKEGIRVSLHPMPTEQLFETVGNSNPTKWQMGFWESGLALNLYPTGGSLFEAGSEYNESDYRNSEATSLIKATYLPGTPSEISQRMNTYQQYIAAQLPVLWLPWLPSGYTRIIGLNVHAKNVHGTVKYFNPLTDNMYANYWTVSG